MIVARTWCGTGPSLLAAPTDCLMAPSLIRKNLMNLNGVLFPHQLWHCWQKFIWVLNKTIFVPGTTMTGSYSLFLVLFQWCFVHSSTMRRHVNRRSLATYLVLPAVLIKLRHSDKIVARTYSLKSCTKNVRQTKVLMHVTPHPAEKSRRDNWHEAKILRKVKGLKLFVGLSPTARVYYWPHHIDTTYDLRCFAMSAATSWFGIDLFSNP